MIDTTRDSAVPSVCLITMGCAKNEVDSAAMARRLREAGFSVTEEASSADAIIVNTCSFIQAATAAAGKNAHRKTYPAHAAQNGTFSWRANKPTGPSRKKACAFFPFFKTLSKTASDRAAFPLAERVAASACFQPEAGTQKEIPARRPS